MKPAAIAAHPLGGLELRAERVWHMRTTLCVDGCSAQRLVDVQQHANLHVRSRGGVLRMSNEASTAIGHFELEDQC